MSESFDLIAKRSAFFANRVDAYARAKGLNNQTVVEDLQLIALEHGAKAVGRMVDLYVPNELHSSRMPGIRKEVAV